MVSEPTYEVAVVGGGPAGLTTALYTTRLGHRTAVVNRAGGRYASVARVHNLIGLSEDLSGAQVTDLAIAQLEEYGADYYPDAASDIERLDGDAPRFRVTAEHATLLADRVVLATGFADVPPRVPELERFTGRGLHYCLHCDAYALGDAPVFVMGHDDHAAEVAMTMLNVTGDVDLVLHGEAPAWGEAVDRQVRAHPVDVVDTTVVSAFPDDEAAAEPWLGGLEFADGARREYVGGFAVYGREYNTTLAEALGCDLEADGAIAVDDRRETSVAGVYAVGDVTHGQNQTAIAIGDGAYAGIAVHKDLRPFPVPPDGLDGERPEAPAAADELRARMRRVRTLDVHAGLGPSDGSSGGHL